MTSVLISKTKINERDVSVSMKPFKTKPNLHSTPNESPTLIILTLLLTGDQ